MTDAEFDILDELYFVISFEDLQNQLNMDEMDLIEHLRTIFEKGWVRVFDDPDSAADVPFSTVSITSAFLLASKSGLKAHNS